MTRLRGRDRGTGSVVGRCWASGLVAAAVVLAGTASARAFDARTGCDVHTPRGTYGKSYRELCDIRVLEQIADYTVPDPNGEDVCPDVADAEWPVCLGSGTEPDRGYRYPLTATSGDYQQAADGWPVCVNDAVSVVVSDPTATSCPSPSAPIQVGTCEPAAHFYERLATPGASRPGQVFYSFVHDAAVCEPCAHDVVSAVATCRSRCDRYFDSLRFEYDPEDADDAGSWVLDTTSTTCSMEDVDNGEGNADCALHNTELESGEDMGLTPLEACRANCGPPDPLVDTHADGPPWVSLWTNRPSDEKQNHWYFVQYGRGWNPNDNLDNWLRSYTVNRDKATAPAKECQTLVNVYCNQVIPLNAGIDGLTKKRNECKANLPVFAVASPPDWPNLFPFTEGGVVDSSKVALNLPGDSRNESVTCSGHCSVTSTEGCDIDEDCPGGETCLHDAAPDEDSDGFCTDLFRGNMLCPNTCYFRGNDGEYNSHHLCGAEYGPTNQACLGGEDSVCNDVTATCTNCKNGSNQVIACPTVSFYSPTPDSEGHATINATSVAIVALFQDGNGNYLSTSPLTKWTRIQEATETETSGTLVWYFAWATPSICLGPGANTIELRLDDAWGNTATNTIVIDAPMSNPTCTD